ncbi:MAG: hypothetical protein LRZ88_11080 [Candidatus Cloacimonetes bacterium]|nr:hypothetical protein [Candidatus Cloacimonadota bacterium]
MIEKPNIILRLETAKDHREVEELTREAFWNENVPGCDEHYLVHTIRNTEAFIPELDFVAVLDGKIVGNIMYARSRVLEDSGIEHPTLTFGPCACIRSCKARALDRCWFGIHCPSPKAWVSP